jgi:hypothetical protein
MPIPIKPAVLPVACSLTAQQFFTSYKTFNVTIQVFPPVKGKKLLIQFFASRDILCGAGRYTLVSGKVYGKEIATLMSHMKQCHLLGLHHNPNGSGMNNKYNRHWN